MAKKPSQSSEPRWTSGAPLWGSREQQPLDRSRRAVRKRVKATKPKRSWFR